MSEAKTSIKETSKQNFRWSTELLDLLKESGLQIGHVCLSLNTVKLINERGPAKNPKSNVKQTKNCYLRF